MKATDFSSNNSYSANGVGRFHSCEHPSARRDDGEHHLCIGGGTRRARLSRTPNAEMMLAIISPRHLACREASRSASLRLIPIRRGQAASLHTRDEIGKHSREGSVEIHKGRRSIQGIGRHSAPRVLVLLTCSLLLFLLFPHATASAASSSTGHINGKRLNSSQNSSSTGHISGKLLDGSQSNAPVANQKVTLQLAENNTARDFITITTDAQGNYAFSALQSDSTVQYAIYTLYQGAQYTTDLIDLSKNANQQVNLTVYDATTSTENIAVVQATILLDKPNTQAGTLTVSEDFFFENLGKTTYVGQVDASHGKPNALSFSLPADAKFLTLGAGFDGYTGTQVNTGFATNAAVPPGTSRFSFSLQVPYSGTSYHFTYKALYPTVALSLLTPTNFQTTPQGLDPKGTTNTQSGIYETFQTKTLSAGNSVQAQLEGLPTPAKATRQQASSLNPNLLWLVALLIVLLALTGIGGYLYNTRRRKAASARRKQNTLVRKSSAVDAPARKRVELPNTKEALLQELLELDKAYEAHKVKKAAYYEQRGHLKARLRELMDEQATNKQSEKRREAQSKTARSSGKGEK